MRRRIQPAQVATPQQKHMSKLKTHSNSDPPLDSRLANSHFFTENVMEKPSLDQTPFKNKEILTNSSGIITKRTQNSPKIEKLKKLKKKNFILGKLNTDQSRSPMRFTNKTIMKCSSPLMKKSFNFFEEPNEDKIEDPSEYQNQTHEEKIQNIQSKY